MFFFFFFFRLFFYFSWFQAPYKPRSHMGTIGFNLTINQPILIPRVIYRMHIVRDVPVGWISKIYPFEYPFESNLLKYMMHNIINFFLAFTGNHNFNFLCDIFDNCKAYRSALLSFLNVSICWNFKAKMCWAFQKITPVQ